MACTTVQLIQGPQGPAGTNGTNGTNGVSAFTTLAANFTVPAELANATATVVTSAPFASGQNTFLAGAGYFEVQSIPNATQVVLKNLESASTLAYLSNVAPGTVIVSGARLTVGGIQGPKASTYYALYQHQLADTTNAGNFSAVGWVTVPLNTEVNDTGSVGTLAGNQLTLIAGTHRVRWRMYGYQVDGFQSRLQNITDGSTVALGSVAKAAAADTTMTASLGEARFTLGATKTLELQGNCVTTKLASGFGIAASRGSGEVYASIEVLTEI